MSNPSKIDIIDNIRSLGFGGLLGSGSVGLLVLFFPSLLDSKMTVDAALAVGGFFGAGFHRLVDVAINNTYLAGANKFIAYYSKLVQLKILSDTIAEEQRSRLLEVLTEDYFLAGVKNPKAYLPASTDGDGSRFMTVANEKEKVQ